jgi:hypothetical protein
MVAEDTQPAPIIEFLRDVVARRLRLQPQRMAGEVDRLAALRVVWMMKLRGERRERVLRIARQSRCRIEFRVFQVGASITVPQTSQVRWAMLE